MKLSKIKYFLCTSVFAANVLAMDGLDDKSLRTTDDPKILREIIEWVFDDNQEVFDDKEVARAERKRAGSFSSDSSTDCDEESDSEIDKKFAEFTERVKRFKTCEKDVEESMKVNNILKTILKSPDDYFKIIVDKIEADNKSKLVGWSEEYTKLLYFFSPNKAR